MGGLGANFLFCTYDGSGYSSSMEYAPARDRVIHLVVLGLVSSQRKHKSSEDFAAGLFEPYGGWQLQWDGTYLAIAEGWGEYLIPRFAIRGNVAHYVDTVKLDQMGTLVGLDSRLKNHWRSNWAYRDSALPLSPSGGDPFKTLANLPSFSGNEGDGSVTVSIAPHLTGITRN